VWSVPGVDCCQLEILTVAPAPEVSLACVGNGASFSGAALAPGERISLFGQELGPATPVTGTPDASGRYPSSLGGTQVTFSGVAAGLLYASDGQIEAVVPYSVRPAETNLCVTRPNVPARCTDIPIAASAPGFFTQPASPGTVDSYAVAVNPDGTVNSPQNPAPRGSVVSLLATGLGNASTFRAEGPIATRPSESTELTITVESDTNDLHSPRGMITLGEWAVGSPNTGLDLVYVHAPLYGNWMYVTVSRGATHWRSNQLLLWIQ